MKLTVLGAGSAFSMTQYQSNFLLDFDGHKMLFDCGSDIRWALKEQGLGVNDIDSVYISHLHSDHIGGLEYLALNRFFNKNKPIPTLYISKYLVDDLWSNCLKGGLSTYEGKVLRLDDYFNVVPIIPNASFEIESTKRDHKYWELTPVQTVHIMSGYVIMNSFGLMIDSTFGPRSSLRDKHFKTYITSDTQYSPYQIRAFYEQADVILEDCETAPFKSHVHAHYEDLKQLEDKFKNKMWLYHYNDIPHRCADMDAMQQMAKHDGFKGFLTQGQVIEEGSSQ